MDETILFDLDGTLTDPKEGITRCVQYALESFGICEPERSRLECFIGPPLKEQFMEYAGLNEKQAVMAVEKYRERFQPTGMFENRVYDGIPEMLESLRSARFRLAVATSKPEVFACRIPEHFGLRDFFEIIVGSELSGARTRKGEVIMEALRRLGTDAAHAVMVGDRMHDVLGAHEAGLFSIGVLFGYGSQQELTQAGADWICPSVRDLKTDLLHRVWERT